MATGTESSISEDRTDGGERSVSARPVLLGKLSDSSVKRLEDVHPEVNSNAREAGDSNSSIALVNTLAYDTT